MPEPPQGTFAALTDMNGPGRFILSRRVTLDGRYRFIESADFLTAEQKRDIFYNNAAWFLRLDAQKPSPK